MQCRELRRTGGRVLITIGDQDIDLSPAFTIFLTTRDPTAEFPPDLCSRVTFINFTVTRGSLQAQCLNEALRAERPDVDAKRMDLLKLQVISGPSNSITFHSILAYLTVFLTLALHDLTPYVCGAIRIEFTKGILVNALFSRFFLCLVAVWIIIRQLLSCVYFTSSVTNVTCFAGRIPAAAAPARKVAPADPERCQRSNP